jgi:hypothetical protein
VRDAGEASKFVLESVDASGIDAMQSLERNGLAAGKILNLVHHSHTTRTDTSEHPEALGAGKIIVDAHRRRRKLDGLFQEEARFLVGVEQALHLRLKRGIVRARFVEVALARGRILPQRVVEQGAQPEVPPGVRTHRPNRYPFCTSKFMSEASHTGGAAGTTSAYA